MTEEVTQEKKPKGRPPKPKFEKTDYYPEGHRMEGLVKLGTEAAKELVPASIKGEYDITAYQRDHCYVYRVWNFTEASGRSAGDLTNDRNISFGRDQYIALAGGGKNQRKKRTASPVEFLQGKHDGRCELINEPKY